MDQVKAYLTAKEGQPPAATNQYNPDDDEDFKAFLAGMDAPSRYETQDHESKGMAYAGNHFTIANLEYKGYPKSLATNLANCSAAHFLQAKLRSEGSLELARDDVQDTVTTVNTLYNTLPVIPQYSFLTEPHYSTNTFIGILIDTGAAEHSTAGYAQYLTYWRTASNTVLNTSTAGQATIQFGPDESIKSIGSIDVPTPDASSMDIIVTTVPIEAHWSIGTVERYHAVLHRSYEIMKEELPDISPEAALQMAVKAVNDTAGPDGLVPTLLVFGAYPRMIEYDPPTPTIAQRATAVKKAMTEIHKIRAQRQIANAINTRNGPSSTAKEINGLLERGIFEYTKKEDIPLGICIFTTRFVNKIKNPRSDKAFEKSRLVIQAYNDGDKEHVLTQSPTIQRASQWIILCAGMIMRTRLRYYIHDITQAYIQSTTKLNRDFYIQITPELAQYFPREAFLKVMRPLYGIPEAGNHWFRTYHNHHTEKLNMEVSIYDPYLLHCSNSKQGFGIIGMQTNDILIIADDTFAAQEEEEIQRAKILYKPQEQLIPDNPLKFNSAVITEIA
ncbi:hypothetical protein EIK77_000353 [Talaromyces pinophilus]|nr:hypothetical protein EIK77_000353 [Talaromyces pinophilus]